MNLKCIRCDEPFEFETVRGYCDECVDHFQGVRKKVHAAQRPHPGVFADGKFASAKECPETIIDPVTEASVCGLCGGTEIEPGYGIGGGYGMGSYDFCYECNTFLNFCEDNS